MTANQSQLILWLNADLKEEFHHMMFYLTASTRVLGINRLELEEFLYDEAKDEMNHIREFSQKILGMEGIPELLVDPCVLSSRWYEDPVYVLRHILEMERKVVDTFAQRIKDTEAMGDADGLAMHVFYEDMLADSRATVEKVLLLSKNY